MGGVVGVGAGVGLGGALVGATVARTVGGGEVGAAASVALALGDAVAAVGSTCEPWPRNTSAISTIVSRLPATAASARSIQRGPPRRGGGMTFVVFPEDSLVTGPHVAQAVPPLGRMGARILARRVVQ